VTTAVDPVRAAELWLAPVRLDATDVLFVIGCGEGHVLHVLDRRGWSGHVVALELDSASAAACLSRKPAVDWQRAGRFTALAGPDHIGLDKVLSVFPLATEKPVIAGDPEVARAHREACVHAARTVTRAWFGARANDEARKKNAGRYLQNTLRNAGAIAREADAADLKNLFAGVPALVVGAGPSLDRNIPDIARYRDRVVVITADTALRPLLSAGIEPDLVVATDPTETNARHLNDLPPCPRTHLVAEGSVDPESLPPFEGRTFFFRVADHHPWPWLRQAGHDRVRLRAWGSVLTTAFDLALEMGCGPIVFAGADLAFTGGRPYARGTTYEEVWRHAEMGGQPIADCWSAAIAGWPDTREIGVTGDIVRTAPHLRSFRDWIASEAARATGRTIINGTGGGILVGSNIAQQSLAEALSSLPMLGAQPAARISSARGFTSTERVVPMGEPDEATLAAWQAFSGPAVVASSAAPVTQEQKDQEVVFDCRPGVDLLAAIEDAWRDLSPSSDRLVLRDCTGSPAGAAVRRALFAFVERHPEVSARFGRFFDPNDDRSWIDRRTSAELYPGANRDKWQDAHAEVANRLTPLFVERLAPASVLDVGCGAGHWLRSFKANGVSDVAGVEVDLAQFTPVRRYDLCLCLCVVQSVAMSTAEAVIASCTQASDTVLFAAPAAAVGAPGFINERPASVWASVFAEHGFAAHDELRPVIESRWGRYQSSYDLVTVYRRVAARGESLSADVKAALVASATRADDLVLQSHVLQASAAAAQARDRSSLPLIAMKNLEINPARMEAAEAAGARCFRFRTAAGAQFVSAEITAFAVLEDGEPAPFAIQQGGVIFQSSDGSDPRRNGRRYSVTVPAHIAWLERTPLSAILEHSL
jgi:SAM-dependent methyltransferase